MVERLVVIGGDAAGMSAAAQARRLRDRHELEILVLERGRHTSYAACGLPYLLAGEVDAPDDLVARTPAQFAEGGIEVRLRHEVRSVDTDARTLAVHELDADRTVTESYDQLLVATGATPVRPPLPGIDATGVFDLRTIPDALAVCEAADSARRAVVVGAGYIGLEVAEAFRARGIAVSLVEQAGRPMTTLDPDTSEHVTAALERLGVDLHLGAGVDGFETDDDGTVRAVVAGDATIETSLVVIGLGVRPGSELAGAAGVDIGPTGGIVVDRRQRTATDGVWAAGDCTETFHRVSRRPVAVALGTHANKQGRVAGANVAGSSAAFGGVLGTAITRIGDLEVARTGLNEHEAAVAGIDVVSASGDDGVRAHYMRGTPRMTSKVLAEARTGRLVGAQIAGGAGSAKRIDVFAAALWNEMTVDELSGVDLSYAPPFAPVWDPVLSAAGRAHLAVERARRR